MLCGKCCFKQEMPLESRLKLAKEIEKNTLYICSNCRIYMVYDGHRWSKTHDFIIAQSYVDFALRKEGILI